MKKDILELMTRDELITFLREEQSDLSRANLQLIKQQEALGKALGEVISCDSCCGEITTTDPDDHKCRGCGLVVCQLCCDVFGHIDDGLHGHGDPAAEVAQLRAKLDVPTQLDRIRASGWAVAVHNDYQQAGQFHTFWLFTKGHLCAKGEGECDMLALNQVEDAITLAGTSPDEKEEG